jgi:hypothetical protein
MRLYLKKNPSQKRAGGVAQGIGPEFKPSTTKKIKGNLGSQALMAHTYNSSNSGGRDQEDCCLKPAWENSS